MFRLGAWEFYDALPKDRSAVLNPVRMDLGGSPHSVLNTIGPSLDFIGAFLLASKCFDDFASRNS